MAEIELADLSPEVLAVLDALGEQGDIDYHLDEVTPQPNVGTKYGFGIESIPRDLTDGLAETRRIELRLTLFRCRDYRGEEFWLGRMYRTLVELHVDFSEPCDSECDASGSLFIVLAETEAIAQTYLEQRAAEYGERWIGELCYRLFSSAEALTPPVLARSLVRGFRSQAPKVCARLLGALALASLRGIVALTWQRIRAAVLRRQSA